MEAAASGTDLTMTTLTLVTAALVMILLALMLKKLLTFKKGIRALMLKVALNLVAPKTFTKVFPKLAYVKLVTINARALEASYPFLYACFCEVLRLYNTKTLSFISALAFSFNVTRVKVPIAKFTPLSRATKQLVRGSAVNNINILQQKG
ncbi:hypothetical protein CTA2_6114 [Colletotrichum tanaceti]|uniref:Uncharacterized protein n=1 Tax=Colletotrichum tanaceti TaxID=1306861 RepID=A0A4U6X213_9PEZI|nr:hypothetical protein CTA2_6114 [Colletotrichum tanaceti]TKW49380.1 hypothetical protein CTA1_2336 [Colletotrichum tanaceti]